jgi:hypothetical protein
MAEKGDISDIHTGESVIMFIASTILMRNLLPLRCIPAIFTLYGDLHIKYANHGC